MNRKRLVRGVALLIAWAIVFLGVVKSVETTLAWWTGAIDEPAAADWAWMLLLPVWVYVYGRYLSIFRPGCATCLDEKNEETIGPRGA